MRIKQMRPRDLRNIESLFALSEAALKMPVKLKLRNDKHSVRYKLTIGNDWQCEGGITQELFETEYEQKFAVHIWHAIIYYSMSLEDFLKYESKNYLQ